MKPKYLQNQEDTIWDISSIVFGVMSPEEIKDMAVCRVNNTKVIGRNTVYDARMGKLTDSNDKCVTCGLKPTECPGHFGYIELEEKIIHPLFTRFAVTLLSCFCRECYRLIVTKKHLEMWGYLRYSSERRVKWLGDKLSGINICLHCNTPQPNVRYKQKEDEIHFEYVVNRQKTSVCLTVAEIEKIFNNISDEDIILLGLNPQLVRPRNLIMSVFPVLPPADRPYLITGGNICDDDLTGQIVEIIKDNAKIRKSRGNENKEKKDINSLKFHIRTFYDNGNKQAKRPRDSKPIKGIKERLQGKTGQIRSNLTGKRVDQSARTVIGPDISLRCNQIAIPEEIAKIVTFPEKVTQFNHDEMVKLLDEGKANYVIKNGQRIDLRFALKNRGTQLLYGDIIVKDPEATLYEDEKGIVTTEGKTVKVVTGREKLEKGDRIIRNGDLLEDVSYPSKKELKLDIGDTVERHIRSGDIALLNRQPTLHRGSMMAMELIVKKHKTIRLNLAVTKPFNADFDGKDSDIVPPRGV